MKALFTNKNQWYIYVIIVAVFAISILAWIRSSNDIAGVVANIARGETAGGRSTDRMIDLIDSEWKIYQYKELSKIDSVATYYLLGEISSLQVIAGKEDWLFYRKKDEIEDTIGDYEGKTGYSRQEMDRIADIALKTQHEMEERGISFVILFCPNKENIYAEYMPDTYIHAVTSGVDILVDYLANKGVNIVSPKKELLDEHLHSRLYYLYDTHWNLLGGYIGVRKVLSDWGIDMPALADRTITTGKHGGGDLARLAGLGSVFSIETEYDVDGTVPTDWAAFRSEQGNGEMSFFHNDNAAHNAKILLVGDSFRTAMIPALREQFADVYIVHRKDFAPSIIDDIMPQYVIAEYVERDSREIYGIDELF